VWDETRVLAAELAEPLVEARRRGDRWVLAAMNNDKPLTLSVPLDFLGEGAYTMRVFADKPESEASPSAIADVTRPVTRGEKLEIRMATAGGFAATLAPAGVVEDQQRDAAGDSVTEKRD
jgi:alpha-glucosidase